MCAPTTRGAAYLAASVFIYRSILLVIACISHAISGYKMTYLNLDLHFLDEVMLHLFYFIPLFTSSGFALTGVEERSFNFVFYSTISLSVTLFVRYTLELAYIYAFDWTAFRLKTPSLFLNLVVDSIFIIILLTYAYQELRDPAKRKLSDDDEKVSDGMSRPARNPTSTTTGTPGTWTVSSTPNISNVHNKFEKESVKNSNLEADQNKSSKLSPKSRTGGIGIGAEPGEALHYPITPVRKDVLMKPLPPLPAGTTEESRELDDISLPPPIPLASPEYDDV